MIEWMNRMVEEGETIFWRSKVRVHVEYDEIRAVWNGGEKAGRMEMWRKGVNSKFLGLRESWEVIDEGWKIHRDDRTGKTRIKSRRWDVYGNEGVTQSSGEYE